MLIRFKKYLFVTMCHVFSGTILLSGVLVVIPAADVTASSLMEITTMQQYETIHDSLGVFPEVEGSNLNGQKFRLPQDLEGRVNIVLVAFQREQQTDIDTWLPALDSLAQDHSELNYYELPTISRMNPVIRWFITRGMRGGIDDPEARYRTITLFIDKEPFQEALNIAHEDTIYIFLVEPQGHVLWRTEGVYSDDKGRELRQAVLAVLRNSLK